MSTEGLGVRVVACTGGLTYNFDSLFTNTLLVILKDSIITSL